MSLRAGLCCGLLSVAVTSCGGAAPAPPAMSHLLPDASLVQKRIGNGAIAHVIIVFQENRSTDNLFHGLPGADIANSGLNSAGQRVPLTPVHLVSDYDVDHMHNPAFLTEYNGGKMNGFDQVRFFCPPSGCRTTPTAYAYVPNSDVEPYIQMAEQYTFADHMFQSNSGPSFAAHQYIISGTSITAPGSTLYSAELPFYKTTSILDCGGDPNDRVPLIDIHTGQENAQAKPCFDHPTLFDRLDAKGLTYKYYLPFYGGLWDGPDMISRIHFGPDYSHIVVGNTNVLTDISNGQLPAVSWVIPTNAESDHASDNNGSGPDWVASIVNAVGSSAYWNDTVIFVTWDDWGGWYDHVKPPQYNAYELGFRVPLIVISRYAKPGYVSHVQHEFGSLLKFTEEVFGLPSLGYTDARADDLADCFNFLQPLRFKPIAAKRNAEYFMRLPASTAPVDTDF